MARMIQSVVNRAKAFKYNTLISKSESSRFYRMFGITWPCTAGHNSKSCASSSFAEVEVILK